jgi:hypothetical protein
LETPRVPEYFVRGLRDLGGAHLRKLNPQITDYLRSLPGPADQGAGNVPGQALCPFQLERAEKPKQKTH